MSSQQAVPRDAFGLTRYVARPLERVPVRCREGAVTGAAWRLQVTCDQGAGGIVLVDVSPSESFFRGDGVFLGWPQGLLAEAYKVLTEPLGALDTDLELLQLG